MTQKIVGYEIERFRWNGSFFQKLTSIFFTAEEEEKAEAVARTEIQLGVKCGLYTLIKNVSEKFNGE